MVTSLDAWRGRLLPVILVYILCRGLLLTQIVPPWQGPDEPSHLEYVVLTLRERGLPRETDPALQAQLLRSMESHRWHAWLGEPAPAAPPASFEDLPRLADAPTQVGNETPLGYLPYLPAAFFGLPFGPARALTLMRLTSLLLTLLFIITIGIVSRRTLGSAAPASGATTLVVATAPMLGFAGAMLGNDLPAAILATLWFGLAWSEQGKRDSGSSRAWILLGLALFASLSKRSALFLLPLSLLHLLGPRLAMRYGRKSGRPQTRPTNAGDALPAEQPEPPEPPKPASLEPASPGTSRNRLFVLAFVSLIVGIALITLWPQLDEAAGWDRVGRSWGDERSAEAARNGRAGLRIEDDSPDSWQYLEQWIPVSPGRFIAASAWFREAPPASHEVSRENEARSRNRPRAQLVLNSEAGDWWHQTVELGKDWRQVQLEFQVPTGVERIRVALVPGDGTVEGMARLDADDVRVTNQHSSSHREALSNGDAETPRQLGTTLWAATLRYVAAPRLAASVLAGLSDPAGTLATAGRGLSFSFHSFWGGFGWLTIWPGGGYYSLARILTLWTLAGSLLALLRPVWLAGGDAALARILRHAALATTVALIVAIAGSMAGTAGSRLPQGRYLLPALLPMVLPAIALAERLLPRRGPIVLALAALALDLWALFFVIWPAYRGPI